MANKPVVDLESLGSLSYGKRSCLEIVTELRQAHGSNAKLEILKKAAANTAFVQVLYLTYSPRIRFYIRQIPEYAPAAATAYHMERIVDMLKSLYLREVTGNRAEAYLKDILEFASGHDAAVVELMIARDLDCGVGVGLINKAFPNLIPEYPSMLCSSFDAAAVENFKYPAFIQPKMDGMRANLTFNRKTGAVDLFLRNGNQIDDVPPHLADVVANEIGAQAPLNQMSFVLDGELLVLAPDGTYLNRQSGNGVLTKVLRGTASADEISRVVFVTWDLIEMESFWKGDYQATYQVRFGVLSDVLEKISVKGVVRPILNRIVNNPKDANEFYSDRLAEGQEGAVLKEPGSFWKDARVKWQLKMKVEDTTEVRVIGVEEGRGKNVGKLGALICETLDGQVLSEPGTGFSDAQRAEYWANPPIGKIATVQFNGVVQSKDPDKKPKHYLPVFIELRVDL